MVKVSVAITAYNHEAFIAEALESVLMQQTTFPFEIVIGEDQSPDNTRAILKGFRQRQPDLIRLLLNERNEGPRKNFVQTLGACRGEYVALLDGDDYWSSDTKLSEQVRFLDSHPECSMCFHPVNRLYEGGRLESSCPANKRELYTLRDLLSQPTFIETGSVMFRRGVFGDFPQWYHDPAMPTADWSLHMLNARQGLVGYLDKVMGVYRIHDEGLWSGQDAIGQVRLNIATREFVRAQLNVQHRRFIDHSLASEYLYLANLYEREGLRDQARTYWAKSIATSPLNRASSFHKDLIAIGMKLYLPALASLMVSVRDTFAQRG